jgi:hypothetical protein
VVLCDQARRSADSLHSRKLRLLKDETREFVNILKEVRR